MLHLIMDLINSIRKLFLSYKKFEIKSSIKKIKIKKHYLF